MSEQLLLVSLPSSAAPSGGDPQTQLDKWLAENLTIPHQEFAHFDIPSFKIGTLDNLVQQSEELAKYDGQLESIASKAADIINSLYDSENQIKAAKVIDNRYTSADYLKHFQWNSSKYRVDKSIGELVDLITKEVFSLDNDVRTSYNSYSTAKSNLSAVDRKQTGNLSVRSLHDVVKREHFVLESEYLRTVLVAVPKASTKEFLASYETLVPMVVPRSAGVIAEDSEYVLYNVTLFQKYVSQFVAKLRDHKWSPREFKYSDTLVADLRKEQAVASETERKLWGEVVRLSKAAYADIVKGWAHIKALRVFVESVLRYGLPPNFLTSIFVVPSGRLEKIEKILIEKFGYLGGNAFEKDTRGRLKGDSDLHEYGALVEADYKPFVLYVLPAV
ncbi:H(+)-transporting V1 sector ATPase subunit C [Sugiyamaella lignohabitans]|uniref:V-type proton ATPase subunit C n=1 Tax=Sugiyamaella lignohabitans TaxID=796027 RepID=A0A167FRD1_9ASCO|nr:H(+)-transporting V1 sector ATPase subunit C [Sugiyamaella lignohabitans]ANB15603.1 H(+)-transporting V1 sector ATPase subunit C [Sugiyamaella lignohabitans]